MAVRERRKSSAIQLLLLSDVVGLGRKGDLVRVKPGYARNFLVPRQKGVIADPHTLRLRARLQEERAKQAALDLEISEALAGQINGITLATHVKVDPDGHMYGSVAVSDVLELLKSGGFEVERKYVHLARPIREIGLHVIELRLKEEVSCSFKLKVIPEGMDDLPAPEEKVVAPEESPPAEEPEEESVDG